MYREQNIGQALSELKKLDHDMKNSDMTLDQSMTILDQATDLVEKIKKEYFDKTLNVVQVQNKSSDQTEEVEFLIK